MELLNHEVTIYQSAVGWDYQEKLVKHESQTDGNKGGNVGLKIPFIFSIVCYMININFF